MCLGRALLCRVGASLLPGTNPPNPTLSYRRIALALSLVMAHLGCTGKDSPPKARLNLVQSSYRAVHT